MAETVAFLFSDLAGSTGLLADLGADIYGEVLSAYRDAVEKSAAEHEGEVVDREGDGIFLVFPTAAGAIRAAADAQRSLAEADWLDDADVAARMGVHVGEAQRHADGYVGLDVHRAARVGSAAHGGQVLVSEAARVLAADALDDDLGLRDLDEHRLEGLDDAIRLHQLVAPGLAEEFPPLRTLEGVPNNLPVQPTSFVGRERELEQVVDLVRDHRLVTLTGVGGAGKTRLALEASARLIDEHPDGVWLVELAATTDPDLVAHQLATVLGVRADQDDGATPIVDLLVDHLAARRVLVVLDNCEHVLAVAARLCDHLLRDCADLTVLATSREGLGVPGEHLWQVPSLSLPDPEADLRAEAVDASDAVRLFVERAQATVPSFGLDDDTRPLVTRICRRLDGIPLAIELAAARVRVLGLERLAERLDDRFRLLTGGSRTALPRQRTLAAAIDWSYQLLDDVEAALFARLAGFAGSFTLEAAEEICSGDGIDELDVIDLLADLVDKSLVATVDTEQGGVRYRLLETLRAYARDRLTETEHAETLRRRHRDHFLALAEQAAPHLYRPERHTWLERIEADRENLQAALDWSLPRGADEGAVTLACALAWVWRQRGYHERAITTLRAALEARGLEPTHEAELREQLAAALFAFGDFAAALAEAEHAHDLVADAAPSPLKARTLERYATMVMFSPERGVEEAIEPARRAVDAAGATGDRSEEIRARETLGGALCWLGATSDDVAMIGEGLRHRRRALRLAREVGDPHTIGHVYGNLVISVEFLARRADEARDLVDELLSWMRSVEARAASTSMRFASSQIAYVFLRSGEWDRAERALAETADHHVEGNLAAIVHQIRCALRWMQGRLPEAAAEAVRLRDVESTRWKDHHLFPLEAEIAVAAGRPAGTRTAAREHLELPVDVSEEAMKAAVLRPLVQAEVDAALSSTGEERDAHVGRARDALQRLRDLVERFPPPVPAQFELPPTNLALAEAELSRVTGPDPDLWRAAHDQAYYRYWQLYARWRLAEALLAVGEREEGEAVLRATHAEAAEIGAGLIRDELEALADPTGVTLPRR